MPRMLALLLTLSLTGCVLETSGPEVLDTPTNNSGDTTAGGGDADGTVAPWDTDETDDVAVPGGTDDTPTQTNGDDPTDPGGDPGGDPGPGPDPEPEPMGPPATTKTQMSYIFIAHPDDEIASWSTIENSSGNYHVFVLLTRGGHTGHCENPVDHAGLDQYPATPRDSEACKANRIASFHKFLNRAAATDPYLDVLDASQPVVADNDPAAGRYEVWAGANSARVIFDFPDGGLRAANLLTANGVVRSLKGSVLPNLPDFQAMAASFWNANYPDCAVYEHADHRAVHTGVFNNDLDTTIQRGRTCASDPDATYDRVVSDATWRTLAGSPNYNEAGGDPGIYRISYGWLSGGWKMSTDQSTIISKRQSFWERRF